MRALAFGLALVALGGCAVVQNTASAVGIGAASPRGSNSITINDVKYRSSLDISGPEKRQLTITVRPVRVNPRGAQEAGRYRATVYCLRAFGSSDTEWTIGPDIPPERLRIVDDSITLQGRCSAR
jgi:hypothetical protein